MGGDVHGLERVHRTRSSEYHPDRESETCPTDYRSHTDGRGRLACSVIVNTGGVRGPYDVPGQTRPTQYRAYESYPFESVIRTFSPQG